MPCSSRRVRKKRVEFGAFAIVQPGSRLVEAQQHRVGAHGAGDFEPPLRAVGEGARRIVGAVGKADAIEPVARLVDGVRFGASHSRVSRPGRAR